MKAKLQHDLDLFQNTRNSEDIMLPEKISMFKPSSLSFNRILIKKMIDEQWNITTTSFELDNEGNGIALYNIKTPSNEMKFVVFSEEIEEGIKTERITASQWDGVAFLYEGELTKEVIEKTKIEIKKVMTGRAVNSKVIGWTRANRSTRFFNHVVDRLSSGKQPDMDFLSQGGYIMRNSGFFGNGKHGTALYSTLGNKHPLYNPYSAEMLALYMWRHFSFDLVEHVAKSKGNQFVHLDYKTKRYMGIGNSSGVGMIPFIINHPKRIHYWIKRRELAIALVKRKKINDKSLEVTHLIQLLERCVLYFKENPLTGKTNFTPSEIIANDLTLIKDKLEKVNTQNLLKENNWINSWKDLCDWASEFIDQESLEVLHSLLIEINPEVVKQLDHYLQVEEETDVIPEMSLRHLKEILSTKYKWALNMDKKTKKGTSLFWYLSEEHREPRIGNRDDNNKVEFEMYVDVPSSIQDLYSNLNNTSLSSTVASYLIQHPYHRSIIERVQSTHDLKYAEVRGNLTHQNFSAVNLIRFLLSQFGMEKFDPQSDKWVQGTFMQGAPLAEDIATGIEDDWIYPIKP